MKNTKTVLIIAAVTGALLLGGCGSEKTKIYEQAGKDLSQGSYKYALEEYQSSIQNGSEAGTVLSRGRYRKPASWQI